MSKNILNEEIALMKKLFDIKGGFIISEQADLGYDIATIQAELNNTNSDEKKIVDILKNYKDKASFKNFLDQYKSKSGKDFATDIYKAIQPYSDKTEWNDLKAHLATFGITLGNSINNKTRTYSATFGGLDGQAPEQKGNDRQTNINNVFCNVKGGVIILPNSKQNNVKWEDYKKVYKLNQNEILAAAKTCPNAELSKTVKTNKNTNVDVNNRFTKSASSLGIKNAKMDVQSLQTILNQLSGTQSSTVATGGQQPDLAALQNTLNQLTTS